MKRYLGKKKLLKIYIDTLDKHDGKPLWEELLKKVKEHALAGATVYKADAGIGAFSQIHSFKVWSLAQELPVIVEIIDEEEKIRNFLNAIDSMMQNALVTLTDTEVIRYKHENFDKEGAKSE